MSKKFIRKLIDVEIRLGFLHIPDAGIEMMQDKDGKISVTIDGKENELTQEDNGVRLKTESSMIDDPLDEFLGYDFAMGADIVKCHTMDKTLCISFTTSLSCKINI